MAFIFLTRPKQQAVSDTLKVADPAPALANIELLSNTTLIVFLRHVGCPFAENTVKQVRNWSASHAGTKIILVSHGDEISTANWLQSIGGQGSATLLIDENRTTYGKWGLGYSGLMHFMGLASLSSVVRLMFNGIINRSAAGTRFQKSGVFLVKHKTIAWCHVNTSAEQLNLP
jgi:hypothetical protein